MSNSPFSGLESLRPLCGAGLLYLVFLVLVRLALWPLFVRWRRNQAPRYINTVGTLLAQLLLWSVVLAAAFFGYMALTGERVTLDFNLANLVPGEIPPWVALLVLVLLLLAALLPRGGGSRRR